MADVHQDAAISQVLSDLLGALDDDVLAVDLGANSIALCDNVTGDAVVVICTTRACILELLTPPEQRVRPLPRRRRRR